MARDVEQLVLTMSADIRRMEKALDRAQGKFDKTARDIEKRQRELDKNLAKLGSAAGDGLGRLSAVSAVALGALTAFSINAAKRAEAVNGAFEQTFRDMPVKAQAAVSEISDQFNRLETDIKDNFTQLRSVLVALGVDAEQSMSIVDQLQRRSLDIAAFRDVSDAEAFRAVISGITGETEPLKRFGIIVNETATKAELMRLGFKGNTTDASEAAKSIARANIILRQSAEMQGQVARESNTLSEQQKRTRKEFIETAERLGDQFLPIAKDVLTWTTEALEAFNDLPTGVQNAGLALLALVAAGGPIAATIKGLTDVVKAAIAARAAMAAVGGTAAASGAAAAAGVTGGVVAGVGAATLAPLALSGDTPNRDPRAKAQHELNNLLELERGYYERLEELGQSSADLREKARIERYLKTVKRGIDKRNAVLFPSTPADPLAAALAGLPSGATEQPEFNLKSDQLTGQGGGKGAAAALAKAQREAARAADLELRQRERTDALLARADDDLVSFRQQLAVGAEERYRAELETIDHERRSRQTELDYAVKQGDLTAAQREEVDLAEERVRRRREELAQLDRDEQRRQDVQDARLSDIEIEGRALAQQAELARTAAARRDAELRLLALQIDEEKVRLEGVIASRQASAAQKENARRQLAALEASRGDAEEIVRRSTQGALERFTDDIPRSVEEVNEALGRMAAEGLENLSTGLADAIVSARSLGDVARNVFRQMAADLIASTIRQSVTGPLAAALGGKIPGFRSGTSFAPGGLSYVHQDELLNLPRGSQVIPSHALRAIGNLTPQAGAGGRPVVNQFSFDLSGAVVTDDLLAQVNTLVAQGAVVSANVGSAKAQAAMQRRSQRSLR